MSSMKTLVEIEAGTEKLSAAETQELRLFLAMQSIAQDWAWLAAITGPVDEAFEQAVSEQPGDQQRPALHFL